MVSFADGAVVLALPAPRLPPERVRRRNVATAAGGEAAARGHNGEGGGGIENDSDSDDASTSSADSEEARDRLLAASALWHVILAGEGRVVSVSLQQGRKLDEMRGQRAMQFHRLAVVVRVAARDDARAAGAAAAGG
jgi:hypothetical protein